MKEEKVLTVLEAGGTDRPLLHKGRGYTYDGIDIEDKEECYKIYDNFIIQSIEEPIPTKYDLILSITLLEHVPDNKAAVQSIFQALNPGGVTHHYLPSKYHPYALALRIIGPTLQKRLIPILRPGTENVTGYPTFFNNCSIPAMRNLFEQQGFTKIQIKTYYNANDYFAFCLPLFIVVTAFENICKTLNLEFFASGFVISARAE